MNPVKTVFKTLFTTSLALFAFYCIGTAASERDEIARKLDASHRSNRILRRGLEKAVTHLDNEQRRDVKKTLLEEKKFEHIVKDWK